MKRLRRPVALCAALSAATLALGACGSDDDDGGAGKAGGEIKIGTVGPDSYDPALFLTVQAVQALHPVYTGLTTYAAAEGEAGGEVDSRHGRGAAQGLRRRQDL